MIILILLGFFFLSSGRLRGPIDVGVFIEILNKNIIILILLGFFFMSSGLLQFLRFSYVFSFLHFLENFFKKCRIMFKFFINSDLKINHLLEKCSIFFSYLFFIFYQLFNKISLLNYNSFHFFLLTSVLDFLELLNL